MDANLLTATSAVNTAPSFAFGGSGKVVTSFVATGNNRATSVALQSDGKILVAGDTNNGSTSDYAFAVARFNADGTPDVSFDGDGKVFTNFGPDADSGSSIALQADGKILVGGVSGLTVSGGRAQFALVRYSRDGTLDSTFSNDGKVTATLLGNDAGNCIVVQADGKIVIAGRSSFPFSYQYDFGIARFNNDGTPDSTFDGDGWTTTNFGLPYHDVPYSIAVQANGKLLVAGYTDGANGGNTGQDFGLARYNTDGTLDSSFDGDGKATTDFSPEGLWDAGSSVALQSDGKILVSGRSIRFLSSAGNVPSDPDYIALARYNVDGTLDRDFSSDGKVITNISLKAGSPTSVALQTDGCILVAGSTTDGGFVVTRYTPNGRLDSNFSDDGRAFANGFGYFQVVDIAVQADGKILVVASGGIAMVRFNVDGSLDPTFGAAITSTSTLDGSPEYHVDGSPVVLDSNVQVADAELTFAGNYSGAELTLARHGGANVADHYVARANGSLGPLNQGGALTVADTVIGKVSTNTAGTLVLSFNAMATQAQVNSAMQQIAYTNTSATSPTTVQIDWRFSDGNTGSQGSGGALFAAGSTTVSVSVLQRTGVTGTVGDDNLPGSARDDVFDGGSGGMDTAVFLGSTVRPYRTGAGWEINGPEGHDLLLPNIERIKFADGRWALDLEGNAGTTVKTLGAVFGPSAVHNERYVGIGLGLLDSGASNLDLMQFALDARLGAGASHREVVELLYSNVVGIAIPLVELTYYTKLLDDGLMTPASLGVFAADTHLNAVQIDLVGLLVDGIAYLI